MPTSVCSLAVRAGLAAGAALAVAAPASATLIIEPVFNVYPGTGPADNVVRLVRVQTGISAPEWSNVRA